MGGRQAPSLIQACRPALPWCAALAASCQACCPAPCPRDGASPAIFPDHQARHADCSTPAHPPLRARKLTNVACSALVPPSFRRLQFPTQEFSHWKVLAAGGAAGLAGSLVSCPSEHIRTKMQLQRRAQLAAKMGMSMQASRGADVPVVQHTQTSSCQLPLTACAATATGARHQPRTLLPGQPALSIASRQTFSAYQQQRQLTPARQLSPPLPQGLETYKGSVDCAMSILRSHGLKGLYRGMTSTILRDIMVGARCRMQADPSCAKHLNSGVSLCARSHEISAFGKPACTQSPHTPTPLPVPPASGLPSTLVCHAAQGYAWFFYGYEATIHAIAGPGKTKADLSYGQVRPQPRAMGRPAEQQGLPWPAAPQTAKRCLVSLAVSGAGSVEPAAVPSIPPCTVGPPWHRSCWRA